MREFRADLILPPRGFTGPFVRPPGFAALDVEIGCGVGWHPIQAAAADSARFRVAIERTREKFEKFARRFARHPELRNLLPVHADAVAWITHALTPGSVDRFLIPYPNPEPKNPQARWIRMPFFARLIETLAPAGEIVIYTNIESYAQEVCLHARTDWELEVRLEKAFRREDVTGYRTHFEKKFLERGEICHEIILGRRGAR